MPRYIEAGEERIENAGQTGGFDSDSSVAHLNLGRAIFEAACRQPNGPAVRREFDGIDSELKHAIADFVLLDKDDAQIVGHIDFEGLLALSDKGRHVGCRPAKQVRQNDRLANQGPLELVGQEQLDHQVDAVVEA